MRKKTMSDTQAMQFDGKKIIPAVNCKWANSGNCDETCYCWCDCCSYVAGVYHKRMERSRMITNIIEFGDCVEIMKRWAVAGVKVNTCVTSPPYYGLRDYGTAEWEGGDKGCDHKPPDEAGNTTKHTKGQRQHAGRFAGALCWKCGAKRIDSQIGLEATPDEYVAKMVEVFRAVREILRDDGTVWLNLGDSYCAGKTGGGGQSSSNLQGGKKTQIEGGKRPDKILTGLKPKNLIGVPWRVAFALQADGWYLRQDIIWHKPNPMPESVTDRGTKAHEYIFLLSKSQRYYYDAEAIKEKAVTGDTYTRNRDLTKLNKVQGRSRMEGLTTNDYTKKNKRSVWTIPTKPYPEAHFAVFPPALIEPCILAGCPKGGIVLDPFMGSGTTAMVAKKFGRQYLGCELNEEYKGLQDKRLDSVDSLFSHLAEKEKDCK